MTAEFASSSDFVRLSNSDGSPHQVGGVRGPGTKFGATGKFRDLVDGRRMCQMVVLGRVFWIEERAFKATFRKDYPENE